MITPEGWFDWAQRWAGPADRPYDWTNAMASIFLHSMEGVIGSYSALEDPNRFPTAWHGTVARNGVLFQHYPVNAGLAHGGPHANPFGPGFESEGFAGEPLTAAQVDTWQRIISDMADYTGRVYPRVPGSRKGLVEHGEVAATACPSGRYAPLYAALEGELNEQEVRRIAAEEAERFITATFRQYLGLAVNGGAGQFTDANGTPLPLIKDELLMAHLASGGVADHTHKAGGVDR